MFEYPEFFRANIVIPDLNGATSITVTDDQGSDPLIITAPGDYAYGYYFYGITVNLTLTSNLGKKSFLTVNGIDCNNYFGFTIDTSLDNGVDGSGNTSFQVPTTASGNDYSNVTRIETSDGQIIEGDFSAYDDPKWLLNFTTPGIYEGKIYANGDWFGFDVSKTEYLNNHGVEDSDKIINYTRFGNSFIYKERGLFVDLNNITTVTPVDIPRIESTSFASEFGGCPNLIDIDNIGQWDITSIIPSSPVLYLEFFELASSSPNFNPDISNWDVSNISSFRQSFAFGSVFDNGGNNGINYWNTSGLKDLFRTFRENPVFNRDVSLWNVSNVIAFSETFYIASNFNSGLADGVAGGLFWNVSNIATAFQRTFRASNFNWCVGHWDVSNVTNFEECFSTTPFNNGDNQVPINTWNLSNANTIKELFRNTPFNRPLDLWNTSNISNMSGTFYNAINFNQDLTNWDVSNVTNFSQMFRDAIAFNNGGNTGISNWVINSTLGANVTMQSMFHNAESFNQDLSNWDMSEVTSIVNMFLDATNFNNGGSPNINNWDISKVTSISATFTRSGFNQPIGNWDTSNVTSMISTFKQSPFNQDISSWNVNNLNSLVEAFSSCPFNSPIFDITATTTQLQFCFDAASQFNQNINTWDTSNVTNFRQVLQLASSFNQPLDNWDFSSISSGTLGNESTALRNSFSSTALDKTNAGSLIEKIAADFGYLGNPTDVATIQFIEIGGSNVEIQQGSAAEDARTWLINQANCIVNGFDATP